MSDKKEKVVVCLIGGGPWGFRLQGGAGTGLPLVVSKVRRKSKAYRSLYEGDLILSVNDHSCQNLTYDQVMEIADKSGTDLTLEVLRKESNKENQAPPYSTSIASTDRTSSPLKRMENGALTKEMVSISETSTKISEEKEGLRIQSASLLPMDSAFTQDRSFETFTSQKLNDDFGQKTITEDRSDSFPLFSELLPNPQGPPKPPRSPIDTSTSSKTEEFSGDDNTFVKTSTETKREVKGNTEMSFIKKEQESVSKSLVGGDSITVDAMDLNDLINATQKKLESFTNGFKTSPLDSEVRSSIYELKKTETTKSSSVTESTNSGTFSSLGQKPFPTTILDSIPKDSSVVNSTQDLAALNGGLGFTSDESSFLSTETPFGSTTITKKKKMFSSSSFYEEPGSLYPTMEEQVEMARKVADSLADENNMKSKGSNMFLKRVKRSSKWIHEGPEPSDESASGTPEIQGIEPPTPDPSQVPFRPSKGHPSLKLVLDPRHPLDANELRSSGVVINEHTAISPAMCHGLVKDLHSPVGKGAALFAKRKKKSEDWVVDEEKVKALLREHERKVLPPPQPPSYNQYSTFSRQDVKLVKTPWEAAMESPFGLCDAAFARVNPDKLADTVIKAADTKRRNSNTPRGSWEPSRLEGCMSPTLPPLTPAGAHYDIYHAKAPKGWTGAGATVDYMPSYQAPAPVAPAPTGNVFQGDSRLQNGFPTPKKMVFQNFNTVPKVWKGASAH